MVDFFVKSILSLGILYLFYLLVLSHLKTFHFNRYYLLASIVFSLVIPFISIPIDNTVLPLIQSTGSVSISSSIEYSGEFIASKEVEQNTIVSFLPYFYIAISLILFLRFSINLFNIIKTIFDNQKIKKNGYSIVLLSNQIIPYSFFRYVLISSNQYQNNEIDEALIEHEISHCKQWHSLDILILELLKVFVWINPFIWLIKRSVLLNHEFLADNKVLSNHDLSKYKNLLINLVLNHTTGTLISNFDFSFTKQRLRMMTKNFSPKKAVIAKATSILVMLTVTMIVSCERNIIEENKPDVTQNSDDWWQPILKEYNIKPTAYNNFTNLFEMGSQNIINDRVVNLENALFLFRPVLRENKQPAKHSFVMVKSPIATHNLETDSIRAVNGELNMFAFKDGKVSSSTLLKFSELKLYSSERKFWFRVDIGTQHKVTEDGIVEVEGRYFDNIVVRY